LGQPKSPTHKKPKTKASEKKKVVSFWMVAIKNVMKSKSNEVEEEVGEILEEMILSSSQMEFQYIS